MERVQEEERRHEGQVVAFLLASLLPAIAVADPIWEPPVVDRGAFGEAGDPVTGGLLLEVRAVGPLAADRLATWPDRQLGLEDEEPQAALLRLGGVISLSPWTFVLQLDLAESLRASLGGEDPWDDLGLLAASTVDDAYVLYKPWRTVQLVAGKTRVPFAKQRQWEDADVTAPSFLADRLSPDRRLGLLVTGDLGALAYAAGAFEDRDELNRRAGEEDPSSNGGLAVLRLEWTPIAPIQGSFPPGRIAGARGPLPTPRRDPWFATHRVSVGAALLLRIGDDGTAGTQAAFSLQWKWRFLAALAEGLVTANDGSGAHATLFATPLDALSLHAGVELDSGLADGATTLRTGAAWYATDDRRSTIGLQAWRRRVSLDADRERSEDAVVVVLQTSL